MATIITSLSLSFAIKAIKLAPQAFPFESHLTMRKTTTKLNPILASIQSFDKSKQPVRKSNQPVDKSEKPIGRKSKNPFRKSKQSSDKSMKSINKSRKTCKYLTFRKYLLSIRREIPHFGNVQSKTRKRSDKRRINRRFFVRSRKDIHYKKVRVIGRFIGYQGKIIPRRVTKLSMTNQRLMTSAIKKARILGLLPFTENEKHIKRVRWREVVKRGRNKRFRRRSRRPIGGK